MTQIVAAPAEEEYEYPCPGKSKIVFQLIEGETYKLQRWDNELKRSVSIGLDFYEVGYEGGSAEIEAYEGMLEDVIAEMLDPDELKIGWFVMDGFFGSFSRDYYGEVDCHHECDDIRPARWSDIEEMGFCKAPWWVSVARWFGRDPLVPDKLLYP